MASDPRSLRSHSDKDLHLIVGLTALATCHVGIYVLLETNRRLTSAELIPYTT
jgi:hypothetical protein